MDVRFGVDGLIKVGCEQGQPKPCFDIISSGMIWYQILNFKNKLATGLK